MCERSSIGIFEDKPEHLTSTAGEQEEQGQEKYIQRSCPPTC